jgi:hypothetical protein
MPNIQTNTSYDVNLDNIITSLFKSNNYNVNEMATNNLVKMTLKSFQNGKHPVLNQRDYQVDILPVPNMTVLDTTIGKYVGIRFPTNSAMAIDLFSASKNINSRGFITVNELERMKLDKYIKYEDIINISIQNKYTDKAMAHNKALGNSSVIRVVNIESLLKSEHNRRGHLTQKEFDMYFPDFKKQNYNYIQYSKKLVHQVSQNSKNIEEYNTIKKTINIDVKNSLLPKLTEEMIHSEYCRLIRKEYIPRFSKEDHLKDMINLHKKSPNLLKDAIQQSGYITDKSINRLFSNEMTARLNKHIDLQHKNVLPGEKNQTSVNDILVKNRKVEHSRTNAHSKARAM